VPPPHDPPDSSSTMPMAGESPVVFVVDDGLAASTVGGLCSRLRSLIDESHADLVACDVGALHDCDLVAIDVLARLGLTARRLGCALELRGASDTLVELIAFVGLQQILPTREP
jgi:ABC-type transporter Mla MlaB component